MREEGGPASTTASEEAISKAKARGDARTTAVKAKAGAGAKRRDKRQKSVKICQRKLFKLRPSCHPLSTARAIQYEKRGKEKNIYKKDSFNNDRFGDFDE